ncbi:transglutaminase domain-containing protein [Plantactinospora sp. CA-294935]|uniref:transglutaminase domain-containing protein n=1 Tax=Plantactinospora sp. CA-294935 TaxID=3240012 RepID=UPI003D93C772
MSSTDVETLTAAAHIVDCVRRVPDRYRSFTESVDRTIRTHGIPPALLEYLVECGLPHRGTGADRRFHKDDLENIGLYMRLPCPRRTAMRWWSRALNLVDVQVETTFAIEVVGDCPEPGHDGPCDIRLQPTLEESADEGTFEALRPGHYKLNLTRTPSRYYFGGPYLEMIEEVRALEFHILPDELSTDLGFVRDTGLADCRLATRHLVEIATRRGIPARRACGGFIAIPYPIYHEWVEFEVDGEWLGADPFLLISMERWGTVDAEQWPPNRSLQFVLWAFSRDFGHLITHRGVPFFPAITVLSQEPAEVRRG